MNDVDKFDLVTSPKVVALYFIQDFPFFEVTVSHIT